MRRVGRIALLLVGFVVLPLQARGQTTDLAFSRNARTFEGTQSALFAKGVAFACLAMTHSPDSIPCNPALTPLAKKPSMGVEVMMSNGYATLERMLELKRGEVSVQLLDSLFNQGQIMQIDGNVEINFRSSRLNGKYVPASFKFFSVTRNEANPEVDLYSVIEDSLTLQGGHSFFDDRLLVGIQFRSVKRQYVRRRFRLLDLSTDAGKTLLKFVKQQAIYIEPGVTVKLPFRWPTRASLMLANAGFTSGDKSGLSIPAKLEGGIGVTIPVPIGELEMEIDYRELSFDEEPADRFHWGAAYKFGSMNVMGGIDVFGASGGIIYQVERVNAGILYSTTKVPWNSDVYYTNTVYIEIGWQI